jgi:hypothetical protein
MHSRSLRFAVVPALFFVSSLVAAACDEGNLPSNAVVRFQLQGDTPPNFLDVPFPTDAYLNGGNVIDPIPGVDAVVRLNSDFVTHELAKENGFSRIAMSAFYIDDTTQPADPTLGFPTAMIDPKSLPADEASCVADDSSVFLLDLSATDPSKARIPCRAMFHQDTALSTSRPLVAVGPARGIVLQEGHQYAAILTSRVKDTAEKNIVASDSFADVATNGGPAGTTRNMYATAINHARLLLQSALATDGAKIVGIAPYTTNHQSGELYQARSVIDAAPAPVLKFDAASMAPMGAAKFAKVISGGNLPSGFTASLDDYFGVVAASAKLPDGTDDPDSNLPVRAHDQISVVSSGAFSAINFLSHPSDYSTVGGVTFVKDTSGNIVPAPDQPTEKIWSTIALPTAPMPASGYPVVIIQHGLGSWRGWALYSANTFCKMGWAVVAIDSVTFGSRASEPQFQTDTSTDYQNAPGAKYKGPDGIGDPSNGARNGEFDMFGGLKNLGAFRDQLRQASLDTTQLVKMLRNNPDLSSLATTTTIPKFDATRIAYVGDSLGGIEGATAAAIEPNIQNWVLNVAGGGVLQELATNGPSVGVSLSAAASLYFGINGDVFDEGHPLVFLAQTLVDVGDPLTYANFLITNPQTIAGVKMAPRNILQIEAVYDELVANESNEALARAGGYGLALPNVGSNSGVLDMKDLTKRTGPVPLASIAPDSAGAIHDTPIAGSTAVVVQVSPSMHSDDFIASTATRQWAAPFTHPFDMVAKPYDVRTSYRAIQATAAQFLNDGFSGKVPRVAGFTAPIRDVDDDGTPDDVDADPNNPLVH